MMYFPSTAGAQEARGGADGNLSLALVAGPPVQGKSPDLWLCRFCVNPSFLNTPQSVHGKRRPDDHGMPPSTRSQALYAWRLWASEQQRRRERLARGAEFYRDQLLRDGVASLITHAAHMSRLAAGQAQRGQPVGSTAPSCPFKTSCLAAKILSKADDK